MKRKHYLIGFAIFLGAVIGYHYLAASQAEDQIDKALQQQSAQNAALSVQYSSIDVAPFAATVSIHDLTVVFGNHIERARHLKLNMSYLDFLNIYFGGLNYGLAHLNRTELSLLSPSYVNRAGLEEIKMDSLQISYSGNAMDGLESAINGSRFTYAHDIEAQSSGLIISLPKTTLKKLVARQFRYSGSIGAGQENFWLNGNHHFGMDAITWTPSDAFQNNYSFFIKGFGYPTGAIPFESAQLNIAPAADSSRIRMESTVKSELALVSGSGFVVIEQPLGSSKLENTKISLTQLSDPLTNVIGNIEKLFSVSLPRTSDGISLTITGTLSHPSLGQ